MNLISTAEAAQLIHRSRNNVSTHLKRHGIQPAGKVGRGRLLWPREEIEQLVARTPELQEERTKPVNAGFNNNQIALGPRRNQPKAQPVWAVVCATAAARMAAGIRVGDKERYGEIPELTVDDVPEWIWRELKEVNGD